MTRGFIKKLATVLTAILAMTVFLTACETAGEAKSDMFQEGLADTVPFGYTLILAEYIVKTDDEYTLTVTKDDYTEDLSSKSTWLPPVPGKYGMDYVIHKGRSAESHKLDITVKEPIIRYSCDKTELVFDIGTDLSFIELLERVEITGVKLWGNDYTPLSYDKYSLIVKDVVVNGVRTTLEGKSSFALTSPSDHIFSVGVRTAYGQDALVPVTVVIRQTQSGMLSWLANNNITANKPISLLDDGTVRLESGTVSVGFGTVDMSYIAFNDDYGCGSFTEIDFKGKNAPQLAFFCNEVTSSLVDGRNGLYINNGTSSILNYYRNSRVTLYGPNKIDRLTLDNNRVYLNTAETVEAPNPMSYAALDDNTNYRYIAGFTNGIDSGASGTVDLHLLMLNLDTGKEVYRLKTTVTAAGTTPKGTHEFPEGYFNGSIVAYGAWDRPIEFQVKKLPYTGITSVDELVPVVAFKKDAPASFLTGDVQLVSDYIVPCELAGAQSTFSYSKDGDAAQAVHGETFTIHESGEYTLEYTVTANGCFRTETMRVIVTPAIIDMKTADYSLVYEAGTRVGFREILDALDYVTIPANSGMELMILAVNGTDVTDHSEYTFTESGYHALTIGNTYSGVEISVKLKIVVTASLDATTVEWMRQNNVSAYNATEILADNTFVLNAGTVVGYNPSSEIDLPYVAFNGSFGLGTFVEFEFTGKNMPQVAFFCDEVTSNLLDGKKGILVGNGGFLAGGATEILTNINNRIYGYGPYKLGKPGERGAGMWGYQANASNPTYPRIYSDTSTSTNPASLASYNALIEGVRYRVKIGFVSHSTVASGATGVARLNLIVENLDENKQVVSVSGRNANIYYPDFDAATYFRGSIVAYGIPGKTTAFTVGRLPYAG